MNAPRCGARSASFGRARRRAPTSSRRSPPRSTAAARWSGSRSPSSATAATRARTLRWPSCATTFSRHDRRGAGCDRRRDRLHRRLEGLHRRAEGHEPLVFAFVLTAPSAAALHLPLDRDPAEGDPAQPAVGRGGLRDPRVDLPERAPGELPGYHSDGSITSWMPLFLFVVLFGLSMDYHVFILTRIREGFDSGLKTEDAVSHGIKSTAGGGHERGGGDDRGLRGLRDALPGDLQGARNGPRNRGADRIRDPSGLSSCRRR